jgi:hypothetical protein
MASTTFIDNQTTIYAAWLNDVNTAVYTGVFPNGSLSLTTLNVTGAVTGAGFTSLINNTLSAPAAIGSATPNTGRFTTLTATAITGSSLTLSTPLAIGQGGTGLTSVGTSGYALASNGTGFTFKRLGLGMTGEAWVSYTIGVDRIGGTTYTNSNAYPIMVNSHGVTSVAGNGGLQGYVNGVLIAEDVPFANNSGFGGFVSFIVPPGATYTVTWGGSSGNLTLWTELR